MREYCLREGGTGTGTGGRKKYVYYNYIGRIEGPAGRMCNVECGPSLDPVLAVVGDKQFVVVG